MPGLFLSLAGNTKVPDNYCHEPDCGFNNAPWAEYCTRCGGFTMHGVDVLQREGIVDTRANSHYDHPAPRGVCVKAD